jgi:hypothetical protein
LKDTDKCVSRYQQKIGMLRERYYLHRIIKFAQILDFIKFQALSQVFKTVLHFFVIVEIFRIILLDCHHVVQDKLMHDFPVSASIIICRMCRRFSYSQEYYLARHNTRTVVVFYALHEVYQSIPFKNPDSLYKPLLPIQYTLKALTFMATALNESRSKVMLIKLAVHNVS